MMNVSTSPTDEFADLVSALNEAWRSGIGTRPISEQRPGLTVADAYAIQTGWAALRRAQGDRILGRKIGLTSIAVQRQLGVSEPDYGDLWDSDFYPTRDGEVTVPFSRFIDPRIEAEVAFLFRDEVKGPGKTPEQILAATEACALAIEIVDSRIADWKITLVDTIADNASFGGYALGPWDRDLPRAALDSLEMKIMRDGDVLASGMGHAVMGNPAIATTWLVNRLGEMGVSIAPGDVIISGAMTKMLPVKSGDRFVVSLSGQPDLTLTFT